MIPKNPEQWKRIDRFLMSFSPKEKVAIIHDSDPDGTCSAALMSKMLEKLRGKPADVATIQPRGTKNTIHPDIFKMLKKKKITKVIFTDLALHEDEKAVKKLEKQCESLILDHHTFFKDITSDRTVLALPQLLVETEEPSLYSSSKMAYDFASRHAMMSDYDWIAAIGTISDVTSRAWPDFLKKVFEKYKLKQNPKNWFETDVGMAGRMLFSSMQINDKNVKYCYDLLMKSKSLKDVLKDKKLKSLRKSFDKELDSWIKKAPKLMEKHDDIKLIWYEVKPKYKLNSAIATILSLQPKNNDWVVLVAEHGKTMVKVSARCQSQRIAVNKLLHGVTKGLKYAAGGGHVPAAGASVQEKDFDTFKKRILDSLGKNLYTHKGNNKQSKR